MRIVAVYAEHCRRGFKYSGIREMLLRVARWRYFGRARVAAQHSWPASCKWPRRRRPLKSGGVVAAGKRSAGGGAPVKIIARGKMMK